MQFLWDVMVISVATVAFKNKGDFSTLTCINLRVSPGAISSAPPSLTPPAGHGYGGEAKRWVAAGGPFTDGCRYSATLG